MGAGMAVRALSTGTSFLTFDCVSCRTAHREFLVQQVVEEKCVRLQKYGELPRKPLPRDARLQNFVKADLEYYEKGLVSLTNNYGIAAYAYFRRVVENNIARLIEMIEADAKSSSAPSDTLDALSALRAESPMSEKIAVANKAIPTYLVPDGLNPLGRLYQSLSEGVHSHTDEECLSNAQVLLDCLKYLVSELADRKHRRESFKSKIGGL